MKGHFSPFPRVLALISFVSLTSHVHQWWIGSSLGIISAWRWKWRSWLFAENQKCSQRLFGMQQAFRLCVFHPGTLWRQWDKVQVVLKQYAGFFIHCTAIKLEQWKGLSPGSQFFFETLHLSPKIWMIYPGHGVRVENEFESIKTCKELQLIQITQYCRHSIHFICEIRVLTKRKAADRCQKSNAICCFPLFRQWHVVAPHYKVLPKQWKATKTTKPGKRYLPAAIKIKF